MSGLAYYNENDDFCADWLEGLIEKGLIAPGDVDRRASGNALNKAQAVQFIKAMMECV